MKRQLTLAALLALVAGGATAAGIDDPLTNIKSVAVTVDIHDIAKRAIPTLSEDELKNAAEFQLRNAKLRATCGGTAPICDGILSLSLATLDEDDHSYVFVATVKFQSLVTYQIRATDAPKTVIATLWDHQFYGNLGKGIIRATIVDDFDKLVKAFLNDYYAANGR
jgi:hypothetical protein